MHFLRYGRLMWAALGTSFISTGHVRADTTQVLFIGSSFTYTNDLPTMVRLLALSMGDTVETTTIAPDGGTFEFHTTNAATQNAIAEGTWDFVVLQEQSLLPALDPDQVALEVYPFATTLVDQVHAANQCTEVVFFMTWGYQNGDPNNCSSYPPVCTYWGMQERLHESYVTMAQDNSAWCAPVGVVWAQHSAALPSMERYMDDGIAPNAFGSYIAAATLYTSIFRHSCSMASYVPAGVYSNQAYELRLLATEIVLDGLEPWNIGVNDPVAQFTYTDLGAGSVQFIDETIGSTSQRWSFGDGGTSSENDPEHTYSTAGTYNVTLVASDECNRIDTATLELVIIGTGLPEVRPASVVNTQVDARNERLLIQSGTSQGQFELIDPAGRVLYVRQLYPGLTSVPLDPHWHGAFIWRVTSAEAFPLSGKLQIP
ncbi:MAG: PKD domain-containing protein [Flavobacteriales bacterium]|nr:PKD domain-containing protein [Flavobacteriales bacterium]